MEENGHWEGMAEGAKSPAATFLHKMDMTMLLLLTGTCFLHPVVSDMENAPSLRRSWVSYLACSCLGLSCTSVANSIRGLSCKSIALFCTGVAEDTCSSR